MHRHPMPWSFILVGILAPLSLYAASVPVTEDSTLILPSDGSQYTVTSGSVFDNIDIQTNSFAFYMSGGESVILTSADRKSLTSNPAFSATCAANQSSITLTLPSGAPAQPIIVTPSSTCSNTTGGGGSPVIGQITSIPQTLTASPASTMPSAISTGPARQAPTTPTLPTSVGTPAPVPRQIARSIPRQAHASGREVALIPAPVPVTPAPAPVSTSTLASAPTPIQAPTPKPPVTPAPPQSPGNSKNLVGRIFSSILAIFALAVAFIQRRIFP